MRAVDKIMVTARIHPAVVKRLEKFCQKHRFTRQDAIEKALDKFIK